MKYVCDVCGWEQNGKTFQKILNVRYVESEKTSSQKQNKTAVL